MRGSNKIHRAVRVMGAAIALIMILNGCGAVNNGKSPAEKDIGRKSIMKENNVHMDEIITEGFKIPQKTTENRETFNIPVFFSDSCVLQANMAVRIWGGASEDGDIAVRITKDSDGYSRTFYGEIKEGEFELFIEGQNPGGPYTLEIITQSGGKYTIKDVLFGEVFVLGGQSNMGWAMGQCYDGSTDKMLYQDIIDSCGDDMLREMLVWPVNSETPVESLESCRQWQSISPGSIKDVSAVGYFFGRRMRSTLGSDVPIGLVGACMGGTPISEWVIGGSWYNGMVNPIKKMTVRGVLWYQGEGDHENYGERLAALINQWRE